MSYGQVEYNKKGLPKCEICNKHFKRVVAHVRQKHDLDARAYKKQFGFDLSKGICSRESSEKSRVAVSENYDTVVSKNLIENGKKTQFKKGYKGRTKDQVSEQTRRMLIAKGFQKKDK
jgi:hypothetical protein